MYVDVTSILTHEIYICVWGARSLRSLAHLSYKYTILFFCRYIWGSSPPPPPHTKKLTTLQYWSSIFIRQHTSCLSTHLFHFEGKGKLSIYNDQFIRNIVLNSEPHAHSNEQTWPHVHCTQVLIGYTNTSFVPSPIDIEEERENQISI